MTDLDKQFIEFIENDPQDALNSARVMREVINRSPLTYPIPHKNKTETTLTLQIPKFYTQQDKKLFEDISEKMVGIFRKVIKAYKEDEKIRKLFHFSPELHELIMSDVLCASDLPILRVDIFFDEDTKDFWFCEFNADGTSSMAESDVMNGLIHLNHAWRAIKPDVEYDPLVDAYGNTLLDIYKRSTGKDNPSVVITDFLDNAYLSDFEVFKIFFASRGIDCEIEDIRDLDYDGKKLFSKKTGKTYDLVYRRAVTTDLLDNKEASKPLLDAAIDKNVVFVGPFSTQIPHSKVINEALLNPELQKVLDEDEVEFLKKHLPETFYLEDAVIDRIKNDKDHWIIKPKEGYGSIGVYPGADLSQQEWEEKITELKNGGYVVQQFIPHFKSKNIEPIISPEFKDFSNTTGLYVFDGKFAGVLSRLSDGNVVSSQLNRKMVPTYFIAEK